MLRFTDALAIAEYAVGALGKSDVDVYANFLQQVYAAPGAFERAPWYKTLYEKK